MKEQYEVTLENLEKLLSEIEWSIRGQTNGIEVYYITNHKGETLDFEIWFPKTDGRIELKNGYDMSIVFYFKDCVLEKLEKAVSIRGKNDKNIFILFMNHNLNK
jgi:hypothetical protein